MEIIESQNVVNIINSYPSEVKETLLFLRTLIFETADEIQSIRSIEETLKWG